MKLAKAAKFLRVQSRNLFPVPSINSIIRVGKIPRTDNKMGFWIPTWKISPKFNDDQAMKILMMVRKRLRSFAIAFENEDNYLILSNQRLDESFTNKILSKITQERNRMRKKNETGHSALSHSPQNMQ